MKKEFECYTDAQLEHLLKAIREELESRKDTKFEYSKLSHLRKSLRRIVRQNCKGNNYEIFCDKRKSGFRMKVTFYGEEVIKTFHNIMEQVRLEGLDQVKEMKIEDSKSYYSSAKFLTIKF